MGQVWRMKRFKGKNFFLSFFSFQSLVGEVGNGGGRGCKGDDYYYYFFFLSKALWAKWEMEGGKVEDDYLNHNPSLDQIGMCFFFF